MTIQLKPFKRYPCLTINLYMTEKLRYVLDYPLNSLQISRRIGIIQISNKKALK